MRHWLRIPVAPSDNSFLSKLPLYIFQSGITGCTDKYLCQRDNALPNRQFAIELVTAGNIEVIQNGKSHLVNPGEIYLIQIGTATVWKTGTAGYAHKRFVSIEGALLDAMLRTTGLINHTHIKPDSPRELYILMKQSNRVMHDGNLEANMTLAFRILTLLGKYVRTQQYHTSVRLALEYMDRHVFSTFYNRDLARESQASISHLDYLFRAQFGISPLQYYLQLKIEHAKAFLSNRNSTIKQIAEQLGYEDPYFFSRQFKKIAGVSPREFRANLNNTDRNDLQ